MSDRLRRAFRAQGRACGALGSDFMARLMPLFAERLVPNSVVARRLSNWPGAVHAGAQSVPLRIAGALHGLVLDGSAPDLVAAYPPNRVDDDTLWQAIEAAFDTREARLMAWLDRAPQTNEVRHAAVLLPAIWWTLARFPLPVVLSELGASGGINLGLDRFALDTGGAVLGDADGAVRLTPAWRGAPPPPALHLHVVDRAGVDENPLDMADPRDRLRLLAYLWPDQADRLRLTRAAITPSVARPARGDAAPWLARRLSQARPGRLHIVYHSIAWQYFPPGTQAACRQSLDAAGARATEDAPLAHIAMEADEGLEAAGLWARLWPSDQTGPRLLARADFHGRWIEWR